MLISSNKLGWTSPPTTSPSTFTSPLPPQGKLAPCVGVWDIGISSDLQVNSSTLQGPVCGEGSKYKSCSHSSLLVSPAHGMLKSRLKWFRFSAYSLQARFTSHINKVSVLSTWHSCSCARIYFDIPEVLNSFPTIVCLPEIVLIWPRSLFLAASDSKNFMTCLYHWHTRTRR